MLIDRNPPSVIADRDRVAVFVQRDLDFGRVSVHRLVNAVVDDFPNQVMQSCAADPTDVHARPLPNRFQSLQGRDVLRAIFFGTCAHCGRFQKERANLAAPTARISAIVANHAQDNRGRTSRNQSDFAGYANPSYLPFWQRVWVFNIYGLNWRVRRTQMAFKANMLVAVLNFTFAME